MALTPCLLVLALSVAHAGGDVARRPSVQVEELARPADEACAVDLDPAVIRGEALAGEVAEPIAVEVEPRAGATLSTRRLRVSSSSFCSLPPPMELEYCCPFLIPYLHPERLPAPPVSIWPPTELRWQIDPELAPRPTFPATCLPLFWLHERPPLTWPAPQEDRPRHRPVPPEAPPARRMGCGRVNRIRVVEADSGEPGRVGSVLTIRYLAAD